VSRRPAGSGFRSAPLARGRAPLRLIATSGELETAGRAATALEVLRRNAALHPASPGVHSAVAARISRSGRPLAPGAEERLASLRQALAVRRGRP
jgi:hypothetical protein